jgi:hypothetical protein
MTMRSYFSPQLASLHSLYLHRQTHVLAANAHPIRPHSLYPPRTPAVL